MSPQVGLLAKPGHPRNLISMASPMLESTTTAGTQMVILGEPGAILPIQANVGKSVKSLGAKLGMKVWQVRRVGKEVIHNLDHGGDRLYYKTR